MAPGLDTSSGAPPIRPKNDPAQYADLVEEWWRPEGAFAMLHWLAASRAELLPSAPTPGSMLVDIACGGGLFAPHAARLGYAHVGVDVVAASLRTAATHGVRAILGDAIALPLRSASAQVVLAGEVLEHVADPLQVVDEACRVLAPGGTVVIDAIAATRRGRFAAVTVAERIPGGPPKRLHDPELFVDRRSIRARFASHGVELSMHGLFPHPVDYVRWLRQPSRQVRLLKTRDTSALFGAVGVKCAA